MLGLPAAFARNGPCSRAALAQAMQRGFRARLPDSFLGPPPKTSAPSASRLEADVILQPRVWQMMTDLPRVLQAASQGIGSRCASATTTC